MNYPSLTFSSVRSLLATSFFFSATLALHAGALEDYLSDPPVVGDAPWYNTTLPEDFIPPHLKTLGDEGATDRQRGIAVANLTFIASQMAEFKESKAAANELMNRYVMPNLYFTKSVEPSNSCSWRQTLIAAGTVYQALGDLQARR